MTNRIKSLDVARGFTVFIMPAVHTVMLYSQPSVHSSWLGSVLAFLAEGPGAQLFMFLLGFSIVLSKPKTARQIMTRVVGLFCMGYVLNVLRMVIPYKLGILPETLVHDYVVYKGVPVSVSLALTGDILQFAAIAYGLVYFIKLSPKPILISAIVFVAVVVASPFVLGIGFDNLISDHFAGLFFADDSRAFFPVFPWLCYPIAGFLIGYVFMRHAARKFYLIIAVSGIGMLIAGLYISSISPNSWDKDFYRPGPGRNISQTGFVLIWICLCAIVARYFSSSLFLKLLSFCSKNITVIYILQWVLIAWGTGIAGYQTLSLLSSIAAMFLTTFLTLLCTWLFVHRHTVTSAKSKFQQLRFR